MKNRQKFQWEHLELGTCYYPEHWDKKLWKEDLQRMKQAGIYTIRIAEFAWNLFEPKEGEFTFSFFDEFLNVAQDEGMKVIFGTPSATPPAWLTEKYPEVLNANRDGVLYRHGARRHYNYNSPKYRELTGRLVEKLGEHYGSHPMIVGWQIDNELNCELAEFYSESDTLAFRRFLQDKYKTLDQLNEAWGTVFWNQTYTDWSEVHVPRTTVHDTTNPHEVLDYTRFVSASVLDFCKMQSDILRKYLADGVFITTNGMFENMDNHKMETESLDVYTYDSYPNFAYCLEEDPAHSTDLNDRKWSRNLTEVRSICPHFGIMEQQSGANGWNTRMEAPSPKPGQMKLWAMQSVAHGADYISFFRWRTCTMGTEIYWHGILDYCNRDNRKLEEVGDIYKRMQNIDEIAGAEYEAAFGVIKDYDNIWDAQLDRWHKRVDKHSSREIFVASQLTHTPMDYIYLEEDMTVDELNRYPVLFCPHSVIVTEKQKELFEQYVSEGGTLILGCRTGYKDRTGKCVMTAQPGLLAELAGAETSDFTFVGPDDGSVYAEWNGEKIEASIFNDILEPTADDTKVLASYSSNYYKGKPALTEHPYGKGKVLYYGAAFERNAVKAFLEYTGICEPHQSVMELPKCCELAVRTKGERTYYFVLNYTKEPVQIVLKQELQDMDSKESVKGQIRLAPYETKVYCR